MTVPETDLIPNYGFYKFMARISDPVLAAFGGYRAHNTEVLDEVEGQGVFVASNHRANIDSFVIGLSFSRPIHFMAKDSLWKYPLVKQVVETCGAFAVKRYQGTGLTKEVIAHIDTLLSNNAAICIYPEGTRRPADIEEVKRSKLKSSIAFLALKSGVPIVPVGIAGSNGLTKLPRELVYGNPIWVPQIEDTDSADFHARKHELMDELCDQMNVNYQIARQHLAGRQVSPQIA